MRRKCHLIENFRDDSISPKTSEQMNSFLGQLQIKQTGFDLKLSTERTIWDTSGVFGNIRSLGALAYYSQQELFLQVCYLFRRFFVSFLYNQVKNILKLKLVKIHDVSVVTFLSVPIAILRSIWVPTPVPSAFWFFFLFLLLFRTPVSWLSRRPFKVMLVQRIFNALRGCLLHKRDHISKIWLNGMLWQYIVIKRKSVQVTEFGISIRNWPPSSVIFLLIVSVCSLIWSKEKIIWFVSNG